MELDEFTRSWLKKFQEQFEAPIRAAEREAILLEIEKLRARGTSQYEGHEMDAAAEGFEEALDAVRDFLVLHDTSSNSTSTTSEDKS